MYTRFILTLIFTAATMASTAQSASETNRPNVVLIFMDDMGYGDPVCYGGGPFQTPHMDALAASGMRFTEFYAAQAVCTASRSALMTGCYPTRIGMHSALDHNAKIALNPNEQTLAELLKDAGYHTGMVGKWHLGHRVPFLPLQNGFDEYLGLPYSNDMWPRDYNGQPWQDTSFWRAKYPPLPLIDGNETVKIISDFEDQDELTTLYTQRAVSFIENNRTQPFFLYFAHSMVHVPLGVSPKRAGKSGTGFFGDVMEEVDWSIGQVMNTLKKNGLLEKTIVIFTSDNGPWLTFGNHAGSTGGLREGKGTAWDGGVKVPCIISWPGFVPPGSVSNRLLTNMDILPTLITLCKADAPVLKIDGVDFSGLLAGNLLDNPREEFAYYYNFNDLMAIRKGIWKLHFPHRSRSDEPPATIGGNRYPGKSVMKDVPLSLFNLSTDPGEDRDIKDQYPQVVRELQELANRYRAEIGDGLTNTTGKDVRPPAMIQR